MFHHEEASFAPHAFFAAWASPWRCRCSIRWCRRKRRWQDRGGSRPRAWPASKWCTARPAAPARARTSTTGRPQKKARDFEFSQTLEPLEPFRDYLTIVSDTDLHPPPPGPPPKKAPTISAPARCTSPPRIPR